MRKIILLLALFLVPIQADADQKDIRENAPAWLCTRKSGKRI